MKYSYYPGCTLKNKAKALDDYARACALTLGFELEELDTWQCCGGVYPLGADEIATKLSSVRALNDAKEKGQDLIAVCSACYHVLKRVNDDMKNDADTQLRANNYLGLEAVPGGDPGSALPGGAARPRRLRRGEEKGRKAPDWAEDRRVLRLSSPAPQRGHGL